MAKTRVLIVEDNLDNYELVRFLLERSGYETVWAHSGKEGLEMIKKNPPDLVIMDLSLPEMDGWTATQHIKSDPKTANLPVLVLTAHTLPGEKKYALDVGCDGFLSKPMNVELFNRTVEEVLAKFRKGKTTGS